MNSKTKLSAKGQVVIPKDVRDHLGLKPGQTLDVIETGGGVLLRPSRKRSARSTEAVLADLGRIGKPYRSNPIPAEQLGFPSPEEWQGRP